MQTFHSITLTSNGNTCFLPQALQHEGLRRFAESRENIFCKMEAPGVNIFYLVNSKKA